VETVGFDRAVGAMYVDIRIIDCLVGSRKETVSDGSESGCSLTPGKGILSMEIGFVSTLDGSA
jgi:hypothetical protein